MTLTEIDRAAHEWAMAYAGEYEGSPTYEVAKDAWKSGWHNGHQHG